MQQRRFVSLVIIYVAIFFLSRMLQVNNFPFVFIIIVTYVFFFIIADFLMGCCCFSSYYYYYDYTYERCEKFLINKHKLYSRYGKHCASSKIYCNIFVHYTAGCPCSYLFIFIYFYIFFFIDIKRLLFFFKHKYVLRLGTDIFIFLSILHNTLFITTKHHKTNEM